MADLISREALLNGFDVCKVTEYDEAGFSMNYKAVSVEAIQKAPAVDAVEVVRCKDCKRYDPLYGEIGICTIHTPHKADYDVTMQPNDFCSYGVRRADDGKE